MSSCRNTWRRLHEPPSAQICGLPLCHLRDQWLPEGHLEEEGPAVQALGGGAWAWLLHPVLRSSVKLAWASGLVASSSMNLHDGCWVP